MFLMMLLREKGKLLSLQIDMMLTIEYQCHFKKITHLNLFLWLYWYKNLPPGGKYVKAIFKKQNQNSLLSHPYR